MTQVQLYLQALLDVIREPTSNLTVAALLAAVVVLVLLIVILLLVMWAFGAPSEEEDSEARAARLAEESSDEGGDDAPKKTPLLARYPWLTTVLIVGLAVVALVLIWGRTGSEAYCFEACHENVPVAGVAESHESVACIECHDGGESGTALTNLAFRTAHPFVGREAGRDGVVPASRCLGCHEDVQEGVIENAERAIRVSHAEFLESGILCDECHDAGHTMRAPERMAVCVRCHDGVTADAGCETCHLGDPALTTAERRPFTREVLLPPVEDCGGCHEQDSCDECHGIRMPHTGEFIAGDHAMQGAFDRKETTCYRCHLPEDCGPCHGDWDSHGRNFKQAHKSIPRGTNCTSCHRGHTGSFCARCHGPGW